MKKENKSKKIKVFKSTIALVLAGTLAAYAGSKVGRIVSEKSNNSYVASKDVENDIDYTEVIDEQVEQEVFEEIPSESIVEEQEEVTEPEVIEEPSNESEEPEQIIDEPLIENIPTSIDNPYGLQMESKKIVVATTTVNIREGASTESNKLGILTEGNSLELIKQENKDWYKVNYNGVDAYISTGYSTIKDIQEIKDNIEKIVYCTKNTNLYNDTNGTVKSNIPYLEAASIYKDAGDYYVGQVSGEVGYIPKSDVADLTGNFVIVDISDQTATLYENNHEIISTSVVTGKNSSPTTKGLHELWLIEKNRYLKGADYNVYVDYVMFFHNGEGLHDAEYHTHYDSNGKVAFSHGWRSSFGGNLYKNGGSHGCVNMPYNATKTMYETLKLGDKVLVKE